MIELDRLHFVANKTLAEYEQMKDSSNIHIGVLMAQQAELQNQINCHNKAIQRYDRCIQVLQKLKETEDEKYYFEWLDICNNKIQAEDKLTLNDDIVIAYITSRLGLSFGESLMEKLKCNM